MGEVNHDAAVFGKWTDMRPWVSRIIKVWGKFSKRLFSVGASHGIKDVSNIALKIIRSAFMKVPAVKLLIYWVAGQPSSPPKTMLTVSLGSGTTTTLASLGPTT